jgi:hypothetical protein
MQCVPELGSEAQANSNQAFDPSRVSPFSRASGVLAATTRFLTERDHHARDRNWTRRRAGTH